ncbi:MAG: twin-arginine translocase subunit TatB [Blastocatellia bacterium]|nr:twin-arginine translocase subunit TatB [Blastocatellia bacterium]
MLFIFQSIGTQELILIGIVALIFLGPRKLPEYARKIGKVMADLRSTTSEFRSTWEREVNFEEEAKALRLDSDDDEPERKVKGDAGHAPEVKQIDATEFENRISRGASESAEEGGDRTAEVIDDKRSWL